MMQGLTALHMAACAFAPPARAGLEGHVAWVHLLITRALVAVKLSQSFKAAMTTATLPLAFCVTASSRELHSASCCSSLCDGEVHGALQNWMPARSANAASLPDVLKLLISHGANVNAKSDEVSAT